MTADNYKSVAGTYREYVWGGEDWDAQIVPDGDGDLYAFLAFPILFGAVHVASWKAALPSGGELWMWRVSTLLCIAIPSLLGSMVLSAAALSAKEWLEEKIANDALKEAIFPYGLVRLYMIVQVFASLRALPSSAYETV